MWADCHSIQIHLAAYKTKKSYGRGIDRPLLCILGNSGVIHKKIAKRGGAGLFCSFDSCWYASITIKNKKEETNIMVQDDPRSEERRVGKECRTRMLTYP